MASEYRLTPEADADILLNLPPAGKYWTFLSSARGDYLYKVDSAGNITAVTYTIANTMTALGDIIYGAALGSATRLGIGTAGQVLTVVGGLPSWAAPAAGGTVTTVSVVTANGFAGTVATDTTTPAITITTSISGLLKGNGTAISAATASDVTGQLLTGYVSGAGVLAATDTILQAFNKLNGNIGALVTGVSSVTGSGNIASSGGATPNITFTGTLPIANGGTNLSALGTALQQLRVNAGATALEYFTPASGGITIGGTTITSGADNRILFQDATASDFVTQTANFTMGAVATGYLDVPTGYAVGGIFFATQDTGIGAVRIGQNSTAAALSVAVGIASNAGTDCVAIGYGAVAQVSGGITSVAIGKSITAPLGSIVINNAASCTGQNSITMGYNASNNFGSSYVFGRSATSTADNQLIIGSSLAGIMHVANVYIGSGVTDSAPKSVTYNATGGSGTNIAGANLTLASGKATGNAAAGYIAFQTSTVGASGSTLQTNAERFRISTARVAASVPIGFKAYTVATLPAGTVGDTAYVTDATAPTYLGALVGGGAVTCLVFYNGAAWVSC